MLRSDGYALDERKAAELDRSLRTPNAVKPTRISITSAQEHDKPAFARTGEGEWIAIASRKGLDHLVEQHLLSAEQRTVLTQNTLNPDGAATRYVIRLEEGARGAQIRVASGRIHSHQGQLFIHLRRRFDFEGSHAFPENIFDWLIDPPGNEISMTTLKELASRMHSPEDSQKPADNNTPLKAGETQRFLLGLSKEQNTPAFTRAGKDRAGREQWVALASREGLAHLVEQRVITAEQRDILLKNTVSPGAVEYEPDTRYCIICEGSSEDGLTAVRAFSGNRGVFGKGAAGTLLLNRTYNLTEQKPVSQNCFHELKLGNEPVLSRERAREFIKSINEKHYLLRSPHQTGAPAALAQQERNPNEDLPTLPQPFGFLTPG
jgi:hypothetical protein